MFPTAVMRGFVLRTCGCGSCSAERDAEIAVLREQLAGLQSQVADLAARVTSSSQNSSKPPSSDGLAKPTPKSLRGKSGRKPGRPKGQPGATMQLSDHPDKRVRHRPARCRCCGKSLKGAPETGMERRQVIDIPPVRPVVTGHQLLTLPSRLTLAAAGLDHWPGQSAS